MVKNTTIEVGMAVTKEIVPPLVNSLSFNVVAVEVITGRTLAVVVSLMLAVVFGFLEVGKSVVIGPAVVV